MTSKSLAAEIGGSTTGSKMQASIMQMDRRDKVALAKPP